jgi:hypothetical protein
MRALIACALLLVAGCGQQSDSALISIDPRGTSSRTRIHLGSVEARASVVHSLRVQNRTTTDVQIFRFQSSCECATVLPEQLSLASGDDALIELTVDLAEDAAFTGKLGIEIDGYDPADNKILSLVALLEVRPTNSKAEHATAN